MDLKERRYEGEGWIQMAEESAVEGTCGCGNEYFGFINHVNGLFMGEKLSTSDGLYAQSVSKLFTFIKMTAKHNNSLNLITGCLYISFFGLHVSVILMTIIRSVRAKEIAMQQRFSLNVMGFHYV